MLQANLRTFSIVACATVFWGLPAAMAEVPTSAAIDPASKRVTLKYDWTLSTTGGGGGAVGLQFDRFEAGAMGFATPLPDSFRDLFLSGAAGKTVSLNWGAEAYLHWFPSASRKGLFLGSLLSVDGFHLHDEPAGQKQKLHAVYLAPRIGFHIPLGVDWLFFEPSVAAALRLWDTSLGDDSATVRPQPVAPLTFLTIGAAIPL